MKRMFTSEILRRYTPVSDQVSRHELSIILGELEGILTKGIPGSVAEFGCYEGTTALFIQRLLGHYPRRPFHVYDSFEGLPPKTAADSSPAGEQFVAGALRASRSTLVRHFRQAGLPLPVIHKGWFNQLRAEDIPETIAFAFLDGDFYESIRDSLRLIADRLMPGAIIIIDDYQSEALPGARRAVDEFVSLRQLPCRIVDSLAVVRMPAM
jgi:O-methyltransferase